jgi:hypothetical protein
MATVVKSVIYAWPTVTSSVTLANTASGVYTTASFGSKTLFFPETSSRIFNSVYAEVGFHDDVVTTADGGLNSLILNLNISGSTNSSSILWTPAIPLSGENMSFVGGPFDFTSFFNNLIPPTSASINLEASVYYRPQTGTASLMQNISFKLYSTYTHNDVDTTYLKTVIIPLESPTASLSQTSPGIIGNQQIPRLITSQSFSGFLPESNVNIRDYFIEIEGNECSNGTGDIALTGSITSSYSNLSFQFTPLEKALQSDTYDRLIWSIPTSSLPNISQSHNFGLRSNIASVFNHVSINLYVTYEYDKTTTTTLNNTVILPWTLTTPLSPNGLDFTSNSSVVSTVLPIFEPNPQLKQSALRINWNANNLLTTVYMSVNSQSTVTSYTDRASGLGGMVNVQHRFDSDATNPNANTANVILSRGLNYLTSSFFANSGVVYATNINGYYIINYTSDVHPTKGVDGCIRNYYFSNELISSRTAITTPTYTSSSFYYNLPNSESLYVIDNSYRITTFDANAQIRYDAGLEYTGSESGNILGVYPSLNLYRNNSFTDAELGTTIATITGNPYVKKYLNQPYKKEIYNPFTDHTYRFYWESPGGTSYSTRYGTQNILVANSYTSPISGRIFNYTGSGQGINIDIFNQTTDELILQVTSSIGGTFSGTIFDDGSPVFASITTGDTYGRSKTLNVSSSLDVYLIPFEYGYSNI